MLCGDMRQFSVNKHISSLTSEVHRNLTKIPKTSKSNQELYFASSDVKIGFEMT